MFIAVIACSAVHFIFISGLLYKLSNSCFPNTLISKLKDSSFLLLEANYDPEVLRCSSYPFTLKSRIAGPKGHLSNEIAGKTISHLLPSGLKNAMLGHLSKESNFPELAYQTVVDELMENQLFHQDSIHLNVASRECHSQLITI